MALEHLLVALERDASEQAAALLADARAEAARIGREAETQAKQRRREVLTPLAADRRAALELALSAARGAARHRGLEARERLLNHVFDAAHALLPEAEGSERYRATLARDLAAALECFGDRPVVVTCSSALEGPLGRQLASMERASVRADPGITAGFRVAAVDGSMHADGTLGARLVQRRARLAQAVLRRMDGA